MLIKLDDHQYKFLDVVVPVAKSVQAQSFLKAHKEREIPIDTEYGMFASVIAALCIHRSDWGKHPVSHKRFVIDEKNALPGNNLAVVNADAPWMKYRRYIQHNSRVYKSYRDVHDFAQDLSDIYAFKYDYEKALLCRTPEKQVEVISSRGPMPYNFITSLLRIMHDHKLRQHDRTTF